MFLLPFILNKAVLIGLSLVVVGSTTVYGGIKASEYRDTQIILQEAKQLSSEGKYQEAIGKLTATGNKWSPNGTKEEIKREIEDNKLLAESSKNYELGKELFDKESYKDALEVLKKVDIRNTDYSSAKSLIELIEKKLEKPKTEAIIVKTEVKKNIQDVVEPVMVTPLPTPTIQPIPSIDPGKTAELRNIIAETKRLGSVAGYASSIIGFYEEGNKAAAANGLPPLYQSELEQQKRILSDANNKIRELANRASILSAECPLCWEEAKKSL